MPSCLYIFLYHVRKCHSMKLKQSINRRQYTLFTQDRKVGFQSTHHMSSVDKFSCCLVKRLDTLKTPLQRDYKLHHQIFSKKKVCYRHILKRNIQTKFNVRYKLKYTALCRLRRNVTVLQYSRPKVVVEWLSRQLCTGEVPGWSLAPESSYSEWGFRGFSKFLQTNAGIVY